MWERTLSAGVRRVNGGGGSNLGVGERGEGGGEVATQKKQSGQRPLAQSRQQQVSLGPGAERGNGEEE